MKDSSAIHFVPSILLTRLPTAHELLAELPDARASAEQHGGSKRGSWPGCRLELSLTNPRDVPLKVTLQVQSSSAHIKEPFAPFHCATTPLATFHVQSSSGKEGIADAGVDVSLGPYEDELLREAEDDTDDDEVISKAFQAQLSEKTDSQAQEETWLVAGIHNAARVSIPLQRISRELWDISAVRSNSPKSGAMSTKIIATLSIRMLITAVSTSEPTNAAVPVDFIIALPIEF